MTPIDNLLLDSLRLVFATNAEGSDIRQFIDVIHKDDWDDWINKYRQLELTIRKLGGRGLVCNMPPSKCINTVELSSIRKAIGTIYWCKITLVAMQLGGSSITLKQHGGSSNRPALYKHISTHVNEVGVDIYSDTFTLVSGECNYMDIEVTLGDLNASSIIGLSVEGVKDAREQALTQVWSLDNRE